MTTTHAKLFTRKKNLSTNKICQQLLILVSNSKLHMTYR